MWNVILNSKWHLVGTNNEYLNGYTKRWCTIYKLLLTSSDISEEQKFNTVIYFNHWISFFKILSFNFCNISQNTLDFLYLFCMKLETYLTYQPHMHICSSIKTSYLFWGISLKCKQKFTCMIHSKLLLHGLV